jgi:hypothetical protein
VLLLLYNGKLEEYVDKAITNLIHFMQQKIKGYQEKIFLLSIYDSKDSIDFFFLQGKSKKVSDVLYSKIVIL